MLVAKGEVMNFCEAYRMWWANALALVKEVQDRSVHRNVEWDGETNCDSPREGFLWDFDIAVILCTFGWHLVWKEGTEVVVLGGGRRGSFGEVG